MKIHLLLRTEHPVQGESATHQVMWVRHDIERGVRDTHRGDNFEELKVELPCSTKFPKHALGFSVATDDEHKLTAAIDTFHKAVEDERKPSHRFGALTPCTAHLHGISGEVAARLTQKLQEAGYSVSTV